MNETKRRFVELRVDEISLVDIPANEKEFAVIKRLQEEKKMAVNKEEKVESVEVEIEDPKDDDVKKSLEKVIDMVGTLVSKSSSDEEIKKEEEKEEETKEEEKEEETKEEETKEETKEEEKEEETEEKEKTEKKSEEDDGMKMLNVLEDTISKAKRFTPTRMQALQTVVESLQGLVSELTPQTPAQEEVIDDSAETSESGVEKALGTFTSKIIGQFEKMTDTIKKLDGRIEKIEKTRNPSSSVEDDGDTDKEKETQKDFWHGTL